VELLYVVAVMIVMFSILLFCEDVLSTIDHYQRVPSVCCLGSCLVLMFCEEFMTLLCVVVWAVVWFYCFVRSL